jgi:hypothetical protein
MPGPCRRAAEVLLVSTALPRVLVNLAVVLLAVILTLGAAEGLVRLFVPHEFVSPLVHVWDRQLGLRQLAGAKGMIITPEFRTKVSINSKGLRGADHAYAKPPGVRRLLCLGDSFTFGYGVDEAEAFPRQLEQLLNAGSTAGDRWEVINAGVPGTGTAHQLAYFDLEGYKYEPDFVLLSFCSTNDFNDNLCGLYTLEGGRLVKHDARLSGFGRVRRAVASLPGYRSVFTRSRLLMFLGRRLTAYAHRRSSGPSQDVEAIVSRKAAAYELTERLVLGLEGACEARSARLVVAVVPEVSAKEGADDVARLVDFVKARQIPYVDLAPPFQDAASRGYQCFYRVDHHWTSLGHTLVARTLQGFLAGTGGAVQP